MTSYLRTRPLVAALATVFLLAACDTSDPAPPAQSTVAEVLAQHPDLNILTDALEVADLTGTLDTAGNLFTVFAPTDAAFETLLAAQSLSPEQLFADENLEDLLLFHLVTGRLTADSLVVGETLTTARPNGINTLTVTTAGAGLGLDATGDGVPDAIITTADLQAANGVIHLIDAVLVPEDIEL